HSVGRAFLEAQQEFIKSSAPRIDVYELKTIAQFLLLGDPSIHLVERKHKSLVVERGKLLVESKSSEKFFRKARRKQLQDCGIRAGRSVKTPRAEGKKIPAGRHRNFSEFARENGLRQFTTSMFSYGRKRPLAIVRSMFACMNRNRYGSANVRRQWYVAGSNR